MYTRPGEPCTPELSIVMPIHNQAEHISNVLHHAMRCITTSNVEWILIFDACSDESQSVVQQWLDTHTVAANIVCVSALVSEEPLFETKADNWGFRTAVAPMILEIQADMLLDDVGFDERMLRAFEVVPTLIGVSGRCCHAFRGRGWHHGKLGKHIERRLDPKLNRNQVFIGETCNRGPLMLHRERLATLGFLDEEHFFLENDEHDLFARAFHMHGWECGYVPVEVVSKLAHGSTRKPRDARNQAAFEAHRARVQSAATPNFLSLFIRKWYRPHDGRVVPLGEPVFG